MMKKLLILSTAAVVGLMLSSPADAQFWKRDKDEKEKKDEDRRCEDLSLEWMPTEEYADLDPVNLTGITDVPIEVGHIADGRRIEDRREIGRNVEDADDDDPEDRKILYVTTDDDIAEFVRVQIEEVLAELGYDVVDPGSGRVVISGDLRDFHVEEDSTYSGNVRILFKVASSNGTVTYEGMHGEEETNWGRSYKCDNYLEVLSDSVLETVHDLAEEDDFYEAVKRAAG